MDQPSTIPLEGISSCPGTLSTVGQEAATDSSAPHLTDGRRPQTDDIPAGYPKLAKRMGLVPETAVFRRFGFLNKLNILYMQAELKYLEEKLKDVQRRDSQRSGEEQLYAIDFYFLKESEDNDEQLELVLSIREKLEKYSRHWLLSRAYQYDHVMTQEDAALIQQSQILAMTRPSDIDLGYIQNYLASKEMGPFALAGIDSEIWGSIHNRKGHEADIVTLFPREKSDMFTKLVMEKGTATLFKYGLDRFLKPSPVHGLVGYEESTLSRLTYLITTALASLLPVASIVVLTFVPSLKLRLGFIAIFTVLLSFCLAFFTSAKRAEIFALTAAFSAIQVVFVQVGNGNQASND